MIKRTYTPVVVVSKEYSLDALGTLLILKDPEDNEYNYLVENTEALVKD